MTMNKTGEFPLYPELEASGEKEAQALVDKFKDKLKEAADEVIGELYCNVAVHIQSDSWTNFRNELIDGLANYNNRKMVGEFDFARIRKQIYEEFREELIQDLNQDLVEENMSLKEQIESERMARRLGN